MATNDLQNKLFVSIRNGDNEFVNIVIKHPEFANRKLHTSNGKILTPLTEACYYGRLSCVDILLKNGADVNAKAQWHMMYESANIKGNGGFGNWDEVFPLQMATQEENFAAVEKLVQAGALVNQTNSIGQSALHGVRVTQTYYYRKKTQQGDLQSMLFLIKHNANVNLQDRNGRTPLHNACEHKNTDLVNMLLENGAQPYLRDKYGFSALEIAAHDHHDIVDALINKCEFTKQEIIEAYETTSLSQSCPAAYEYMRHALLMRTIHNVPKVVLDPMECYGFLKECETLEELEVYKDDDKKLRLQAILARERIYEDRYINLVGLLNHAMLAASNEGHRYELNLLLKRLFTLFRRNDDHLYFSDVIMQAHEETFKVIARGEFQLLDTDTMTEFIKVALESGHRLQEMLNDETKLCCNTVLVRHTEQAVAIAGCFISELLMRDAQNESDDFTPKGIARELMKDLYDKIPEVYAPECSCKKTYRAPLPHAICSSIYRNAIVWQPRYQRFDYELMKLIVDVGFDMAATDNNGNTLLHCLIDFVCNNHVSYRTQHAPHSKKIATLLLDNGMYLHARNKFRKTVIDILDDPAYKNDNLLMEIRELLEKYNQFPGLKELAAIAIKESNLSYKNHLPKFLTKFVDLH